MAGVGASCAVRRGAVGVAAARAYRRRASVFAVAVQVRGRARAAEHRHNAARHGVASVGGQGRRCGDGRDAVGRAVAVDRRGNGGTAVAKRAVKRCPAESVGLFGKPASQAYRVGGEAAACRCRVGAGAGAAGGQVGQRAASVVGRAAGSERPGLRLRLLARRAVRPPAVVGGFAALPRQTGVVSRRCPSPSDFAAS